MENVETDLFGTLLKQFRQGKKLNQLTLAYKIGKHSRGSVQAWESSLFLPSNRETVLALAHALQLKESETDRLLLAAHYPPEYHTQGSQFSAVRAKESLSLVDMDISEHYEVSVLDITLHNSGIQTALPTRLQVDILDVGEFYDCDEDEDDEDDPTRSFVEVSNTYDVKLSPALKGKQVSVKIAHQLRADEVDRFQVKIGPGFIDAHLAYAWYYVKITLLCSELGRTLELDPVLLSIPPVAIDTDITDVWTALDTRCTEQNRTTLRRMSNLSARRSASVEATIHQVLGG